MPTLTVPGAHLHYEVRGTGPVLLLIPTGNGDGGPYAPLANILADRFTVVTYDRRGYSRSRLTGPVDDERRVVTDAHDVSRLLEHVGGPTAHVFGSSSGAIVALAVLELLGDRVSTLICHEPPLASVLPEAAQWFDLLTDLYETYRRTGAEAAYAKFRAIMGMTASTRPPEDAQLPADQLAAMLDRIRGNRAFWFEHEMAIYPRFEPDMVALKAVADRLVLAGSDLARADFPYQPNTVLAERLGMPITHFPGGHVGFVTHVYEFADALADLLTGRAAG